MDGLCNVLLRDSMMKKDYDIFVDVVVFHATYRSNLCDLMCALFVGINNYWVTIMFGCALYQMKELNHLRGYCRFLKNLLVGSVQLGFLSIKIKQ